MPDIRVGIAQPEQFPEANACLTEAFMEDPVISYLFEDAERRPLLLSAFFANRFASLSDNDRLMVPIGDDEKFAAAFWESPEKRFESDSSYSAAIAAAVSLLGEQWMVNRLINLNVMFEAKPETPHWYLAYVGTGLKRAVTVWRPLLLNQLRKFVTKRKYLPTLNPVILKMFHFMKGTDFVSQVR